mmetsp:Transcript_32247/g.75991  ORF Transcript_32247/g.75991 Transcript_32247/m.75991 type:complete len:247 (-) Transcript_32247:597-1337(-)
MPAVRQRKRASCQTLLDVRQVVLLRPEDRTRPHDAHPRDRFPGGESELAHDPDTHHRSGLPQPVLAADHHSLVVGAAALVQEGTDLRVRGSALLAEQVEMVDVFGRFHGLDALVRGLLFAVEVQDARDPHPLEVLELCLRRDLRVDILWVVLSRRARSEEVWADPMHVSCAGVVEIKVFFQVEVANIQPLMVDGLLEATEAVSHSQRKRGRGEGCVTEWDNGDARNTLERSKRLCRRESVFQDQVR